MIDTARISVKAGKGGNGVALFRREKYIPKGGPWGGDGGRGGDIIFQVDPHVNTLSLFRRKKDFKSENGIDGAKKLQKGRDGSDLVVSVPQGTVIYDENKNVLFDLTALGQREVIARGGNGGLGNWHFKSSVNRTPLKATSGWNGDEKILFLELKLIADAGIIGLPNSGKSTLINALTRANVKTADYPFTTLEPNLGVLHVSDFVPGPLGDIVLADIPGLIEGASEGKGLGHDFLRHIERTRILVHLIDGTAVFAGGAVKDYKVIQNELEKWSPMLVKKPQIVVVNKCDVTEVHEAEKKIKEEFKKIGVGVLFISAVAHIGLKELVEKLVSEITSEKESHSSEKVPQVKKTYTIENLPNKRIVFRTKVLPESETVQGDSL
ncbi:hypothetical protein A2982_00030 [candidate division WWE3 bacterium RIFCSPLOWO2_01_FULL_39_13]|uniref:GTPase Obg n=1 Tax=candidate division WWE3 bacterium RIFCSPLOWO2_01_FULL_39_13 TaxID=1802624 RepID=A0A1F4V489_UNCKA|nr:MAG: hypothetical protein A2982_00030 [candidate division WWE3 bacterium RIFCSPLOWO2_01_FULL_39_13]